MSTRDVGAALAKAGVHGGSHAQLSNVLRGGATLRPDVLGAVAAVLGVRPAWLENGRGPMTVEVSQSEYTTHAELFERSMRLVFP
ncbi:MAG: hypothetical protein ACRETX_17230, partial [Steroidobacteraceae bacterium]